MDNVGSILTYEGACVATFYVYSYAMNKSISIIFTQYQYKKAICILLNFPIRTMILENINRKRWIGTQN
jgi:hypothetical protein